ncbi:glycosyltransferase family 4 protein [Algicola sagamiensis]|uniref:glycosyltransferase family 4 protein n=1 Tax=Algicola sagamiensis TaxID=163869 RepID=UPI00036587DC|nr:glycosyltransferase family 4 protein [Algicola sagamiensis]
MKVIHVEAGRTLFGGPQQVLYLLQSLQEEYPGKIENILICPIGSEIVNPAQALGVKVIECKMGGDLDIGLAFRLAKIVQEEKVDLIQIHSRRGADIWGALAANIAKCKVILTRRVDNPEPVWLAKRKYGWYDKVITISDGIRDVLLSEQVPQSCMVTIRDAVDTAAFVPKEKESGVFTRFNVPESAVTVGVIAQLIERKGHKFLIDVVERLVQDTPDAHFLFFGKGPEEAALKAYCEEKGVSQHVTFTGFVAGIEQIIPQLDMVVHPALAEGMGVALLQASACGVPIVASAVGGIPEAVKDGYSGFLVQPGNSKALYDKVSRLLQDKSLRETMGKQGRQYMEEAFALTVMSQQSMQLYEAVLNES